MTINIIATWEVINCVSVKFSEIPELPVRPDSIRQLNEGHTEV